MPKYHRKCWNGNEEERNARDLVRSVMSLYEGAKTRVIVDSELSEKFEAKVMMHVCGLRVKANSVLCVQCGR